MQGIRFGDQTSSRSLSGHCKAADLLGNLSVSCGSSSDRAVLRYRFTVASNAGPVDWHVHFAYRSSHVTTQAARSGTKVVVTVRSTGVARFDVSKVVIGYYTTD